MVPKGEEAGPFAERLEAIVITTEEELRDFLDGVGFTRLRGNLETLDRADLAEVVVVATYYLWRPLKGDPLFIEKVELKGTEIEISLELLEEPQGRESPFLMAPLYVAALDRENLPTGVPLRFVFLVNGEEADTLTVTLR